LRWTPAEVESLLRARGFALTPQRRAIVRTLAEHGGHWTAAQLLESVTREFPLASRATVYSTLALLRELRVVAAVAAPSGELRFDADPEPHQHFVCLRCGKLEDVPEDWFQVVVPRQVEPTFEVERFRVIAEGVCRDCAGPAAG
jgi:Fe2+ or Zn2+ uptake regulation protein